MHEIKTVDIGGGVTLAYREYGTGDKYLLSCQNFFFKDSHMALLGQPPYDYHCFLVYMRGYGESTHLFDTSFDNDNITMWGQDLVRFAEVMGIPSFYYTGISHGNWCAWYTAFNRPEMLRAYVCCDGVNSYREHAEMPEFFLRQIREADQYVGNRERLSRMAWLEDWPTENPQRLARRAANIREHTEILMNRRKEEFQVPVTGDMSGCQAGSWDELRAAWKTLDIPILIWMGGLDPICTPELAFEAAQTIPGAQLLIYQHLGHGGADECPELAARDCDRFFRDVEGRIL